MKKNENDENNENNENDIIQETKKIKENEEYIPLEMSGTKGINYYNNKIRNLRIIISVLIIIIFIIISLFIYYILKNKSEQKIILIITLLILIIILIMIQIYQSYQGKIIISPQAKKEKYMLNIWIFGLHLFLRSLMSIKFY